MAYSLPADLALQGWKVKIRDRERAEPPHATILQGTDAWRLNLRNGSFMAWVDVGMNASEWLLRRGARRTSRHEDAARGAREARAVLTMALASSYVNESLCARVLDENDRIVVYLRKIANRPAQERCLRSMSRLRARRRRRRRAFADHVCQSPPSCSDEDAGTG